MTILFNAEEQRFEYKNDLVLCYTVSGEGEDLPGAKALMEKLIPMISEIDAKCRSCAADELLEIKNDEWLDEDEDPISREDFMEKLILRGAEFSAESVTFWYEDGDMFWGHCVMVECLADGTPDYAEMMG